MHRITIALLLTIHGSVLAQNTDCAAMYANALKSDLDLTYAEFDQTENRGMRVLANAGCAREAANLIEAYITRHGSKLSLVWHLAQLRAEHDDRVEAIRYARMSLAEKEDFKTDPLRWNDYVLATIAFLEKDRAAFAHHRSAVAKGIAYTGNQLNLELLNLLDAKFDATYREALR